MSLPQEPRISEASLPLPRSRAPEPLFGGRPLVASSGSRAVGAGRLHSQVLGSIRSTSFEHPRAVPGRSGHGLRAFERLWRYFCWGAVLVVPIWLIVRLVGRRVDVVPVSEVRDTLSTL